MPKVRPGVRRSSGFCRFCGSADLVAAHYNGRAGDPAVARGVSAPGGAGVTGSKTPRSDQSVEYPTVLCQTCREINARCEFGPKEAVAQWGSETATFVLPREFLGLLDSLDASEADLRDALNQLVPAAWRRLRKSAKLGGGNPCKKRRLGFPVNIRIAGTKIRVYLIVGAWGGPGKPFGVRVAYGGGNANCP